EVGHAAVLIHTGAGPADGAVAAGGLHPGLDLGGVHVIEEESPRQALALRHVAAAGGGQHGQGAVGQKAHLVDHHRVGGYFQQVQLRHGAVGVYPPGGAVHGGEYGGAVGPHGPGHQHAGVGGPGGGLALPGSAAIGGGQPDGVVVLAAVAAPLLAVGHQGAVGEGGGRAGEGDVGGDARGLLLHPAALGDRLGGGGGGAAAAAAGSRFPSAAGGEGEKRRPGQQGGQDACGCVHGTTSIGQVLRNTAIVPAQAEKNMKGALQRGPHAHSALAPRT